MLLPIDLVEVIMVATIAIVGVIMWRFVTTEQRPRERPSGRLLLDRPGT
jgi:hypothetical protein